MIRAYEYLSIGFEFGEFYCQDGCPLCRPASRISYSLYPFLMLLRHCDTSIIVGNRIDDMVSLKATSRTSALAPIKAHTDWSTVYGCGESPDFRDLHRKYLSIRHADSRLKNTFNVCCRKAIEPDKLPLSITKKRRRLSSAKPVQ